MPGLDEWTWLACHSSGVCASQSVTSVLAVFKGGICVRGKTGEDKMRRLPQWDTEHWEPGSFKDDVCLSPLPSPKG